jgi:hypothetical protein
MGFSLDSDVIIGYRLVKYALYQLVTDINTGLSELLEPISGYDPEKQIYKNFYVSELINDDNAFISIYPLKCKNTESECDGDKYNISKLSKFDIKNFDKLKKKLKKIVEDNIEVWDENNFGIYSVAHVWSG